MGSRGRELAVSVRDYPAPFAAMLAICSDLDETLDLATYLEISRFLNANERTVYGRGVGLEVGNTMYFDMAPGEMSYWSSDEAGREKLCALMRSGHIDCFHSFGDLAGRSEAARALNELDKRGCRLAVWVDHAVAPTNFGPDIMEGQGDIEGSSAYHADLTQRYGVEFVWLGRVTSVIGQNVKPTLAGILDAKHPLPSVMTVAKEVAKQWLGATGSRKYRMHTSNDLMRPHQLRSGHFVYEFLRCNPHWAGVGRGATGEGLGDALRPAVLDTLIEKRGSSIIYTHLGKGRDRQKPLGERTVAALRRIRTMQDEGKLLISTTAKLLRYHRMRDTVTWSSSKDGESGLRIDVAAKQDRAALQGLTYIVPDGLQIELFVNGEKQNVVRTVVDGKATIALPWVRADYPPI